MEFKLKYADSALGYVWSLLKPLVLFAVLYVVFGRFFKLEEFPNFPLYLLLGIVLWFFFLDATTNGMYSVLVRGSLLRKLAFPRITIPVSVTLTSAMTFAVNLVAVAAFVVGARVTPRLEWLLIPALLLELFAFSLGVALILATLLVRFRDVAQVWDLGTNVLFYASPIIYPVQFLPPWFQPVAFLNPFVQVMQDIRTVMLGAPPQLPYAAFYGGSAGRTLSVAIALAVFVGGIVLFRRESPGFAERV